MLDYGKIVVYDNSNDAVYSPVNFLPQAIGMRLSRIFSNNIHTIYYSARWCNYLLALFLGIISISIIPFGERILFCILMFPMTLQEMVSISPDCMTNSIVILFISYVMYLAYKKESISKLDIIGISILALLISQCKIVYIPIVFLVIILPRGKFKNEKKSIIFKIVLIMISILCCLLWLVISASYLGEFQPGVDKAAQLREIVTGIDRYYAVIVRTIFESRVEFYIKTMIGSSLGALNIDTIPVVWIGLLLLLTHLVENSGTNIDIDKKDAIIMLSIFVAISGLILTSLYVGWTPVGCDEVYGVQGRYFIPIVLLLLYAIVIAKGLKSNYYVENKLTDYNISIWESLIPLITCFVDILALCSVIQAFS